MSKETAELINKIKRTGKLPPEVSSITGIPVGRIYKWFDGTSSPKYADAVKLEEILNVPNETMQESEATYLTQRRNLKNGEKSKVPVYGGFTTLGNIEVIDDANMKHKVVAELPADIFPGCNHAEKAKGDSMYPLIMNQALLIGKVCHSEGLIFGEKYIIKTKTGMDTTKFIHPGTKQGIIKLKAYNKSIPDQEINIEDIIFCCRVHWIINPT